MKGLARRNTYVKHESPSINQSKVITKVKVFADGRTDRWTDSEYYRTPTISGALIRKLSCIYLNFPGFVVLEKTFNLSAK
jgi:hypothetical protein